MWAYTNLLTSASTRLLLPARPSPVVRASTRLLVRLCRVQYQACHLRTRRMLPAAHLHVAAHSRRCATAAHTRRRTATVLLRQHTTAVLSWRCTTTVLSRQRYGTHLDAPQMTTLKAMPRPHARQRQVWRTAGLLPAASAACMAAPAHPHPRVQEELRQQARPTAGHPPAASTVAACMAAAPTRWHRRWQARWPCATTLLRAPWPGCAPAPWPYCTPALWVSSPRMQRAPRLVHTTVGQRPERTPSTCRSLPLYRVPAPPRRPPARCRSGATRTAPRRSPHGRCCRRSCAATHPRVWCRACSHMRRVYTPRKSPTWIPPAAATARRQPLVVVVVLGRAH